MHIENLAHGNPPIWSLEAWSPKAVFAADKRYIALFDGPRDSQSNIAPYLPPTDAERFGSLFCVNLSSTPAPLITAEILDDVQDWMLVKCSDSLLANSDQLIGKSIVIYWTDKEWYLGGVAGKKGRTFTVIFNERDYDHCRLVGFGYEPVPQGNGLHWRLVAKRSSVQDLDSRGNHSFLNYITHSTDIIGCVSVSDGKVLNIDHALLESARGPLPSFTDSKKRTRNLAANIRFSEPKRQKRK